MLISTFEAEACAFVVCKRFGIEVDDYSFGYIGSFSSGRDLPELKASLQTIRDTSAELINRIEGQMKQLQKEHRLSVTPVVLKELHPEASQKIRVYSEKPFAGQSEILPAEAVKAMLADDMAMQIKRGQPLAR